CLGAGPRGSAGLPARGTAAMWRRARAPAAALPPRWRRGSLPALPHGAPAAHAGAGGSACGSRSPPPPWGQARGFAAMVGPVNSLSAARADYPDGSMSQLLLDRCLEAAVARGVDVSAPYEPWLPVDMMQTLLLQVHDALGCSWLAAIVMACVGIRAITLPISVSAIRGSREKALIQPEFVRLTEKQQQLSADGDQEKMAENNKKLQAFQQKHGKFFMLKGTGNLILVQMPLYITAVTAMRGFASHPDVFRSFAMESPLWLDSLALADPYALLPMTTAAIMITNTELFGSIDTEVAQSQQAPSAFTEAMGQG
ncbi:unnamed protein product, partial [Prorocentrum cordatum]